MNGIPLQLPKGFRDLLPAQKIFRQKVIQVMCSLFETYGFSPLETPSLEYAETLEGKYGEEGERLIYKFTDRGGRAVALRYDLTIPLCRVVAMHSHLPKPFKCYQIAPVWRADKPQRGRFREFYQCDIDIVGTASVLADAELMVLIHTVLTELGIADFKIHINHRKLLNAIIGSAGIEAAHQAAFLRSLDKQDKIGQDGVCAELAEKGFAASAVHKVFELLNALQGLERHEDQLACIGSMMQGVAEAETGLAELEMIREALAAQGVPDAKYRFDLSLARGLDYYTGPVFETRVVSPNIGSITGGGRYDNLIGLFTNSSVPATGSSFGLERLMTVLEERQRSETAQSTTQVLVTLFDAALRTETLRLAHMLRGAALKTEIYFEAEKLKKQLSYAAQKGISLVVILGPDEVRTDTAVLRNMRSSSQEVVPQRDLVQRIKSLLAMP